MARRRQPNDSTRVLAYTRCSSEEQARSGLGLAAQRAVLEAEVNRRGWVDVEWLTDDGYSAKDLNRPGIEQALADLAAGRAGTLVVSKLDRLSRSLMDFAGLLDRAQRQGWCIVALDSPVDMTTPHGKMIASVMATFAAFERDLISARTRDALAAKKAQGHRLGRPRRLDNAVAERVWTERQRGDSLGTIMHRLNAEGVRGGGGGEWRRGSVLAAVRSWQMDLDALAIREGAA